MFYVIPDGCVIVLYYNTQTLEYRDGTACELSIISYGEDVIRVTGDGTARSTGSHCMPQAPHHLASTMEDGPDHGTLLMTLFVCKYTDKCMTVFNVLTIVYDYSKVVEIYYI